jgi:hypothetical protein
MRVYLSHPIRGIKPDPTPGYIAENLEKAIHFANRIRNETGVKVYCPAEHEEFIQLALDRGFMSVGQVLGIDKVILGRREAAIFYNFEGTFGQGMKEELAYANEQNLPIMIVTDKTDMRNIRDFLGSF